MSEARQLSKASWEFANTVEGMNVGSLQRIADAAEKMATNYVNLQNDLDRYKRWYADEHKKNAHLEKSNAALRGAFKKLKAANTAQMEGSR